IRSVLSADHQPGLPAPGRAATSDVMQPASLEQFRKLGASLHEMQRLRGTRVVMITSAVAGEGKSFTAANIAITLSASYGRQVLLVDADLRRPALHELFGAPEDDGLTTGL